MIFELLNVSQRILFGQSRLDPEISRSVVKVLLSHLRNTVKQHGAAAYRKRGLPYSASEELSTQYEQFGFICEGSLQSYEH
jgi:hypothetical protein